MSHSNAAETLHSVSLLANAGSLLWLLVICVGAPLLMIALARSMKLDTLLNKLLLRQPSRSEIVAHLEHLADLARAGNLRAARRAGDRCSWRLLRLGSGLLADGAQPAEIAHKLEHVAEIVAARRVRRLRRFASFSCGLVVFPLGVLLIHMLGVLGAVTPTNGWIAGLAFVFVISLLVASSVMRWMCECAEDSVAQRTIEVEALVFGLSAICGGASSEEVGSLTRLMLGMSPASSALRQAA
ncbi:MAG: hypothetical protein KF691_10995 [Phycisphaeraceae bacterium]|nr:hypothetical protein [Phycisphaeraceae bacterium]